MIDFSILTNKDYDPNWHHEEIAEVLQDIESGKFIKDGFKLLILTVPPRHGKQISDNVLVLTNKGWKKHGDLTLNDKVFGINGELINILWKSEKTVATIEVELSNGEKIKCHKKHEWTVFDRSRHKWRIVETEELFKNVKNRSRFQLPFIKAPNFKEKKLEINPYVLGVWLGDGSSGKPHITYDFRDFQPIDYIKTVYQLSAIWKHKITGVLTVSFAGGGRAGVGSPFYKALKKIEVLNNKHIPEEYKFSSINQRLKLLAGLIDTDGSVDKNSRVRITTVSKRLAEDIEEIVISLGFNTYIMKVEPILSSSGIQGKKLVYVVGFNPKMDIPTLIPRKKIKRFSVNRKTGIKRVRVLDKNEEELGNCIQVDSPDGIYLVGKKLIPTHNSEECTINFPAWYLGRNPNKEIITASYSGDLAVKFGGRTRDLVNSKVYKNIFPGVGLKAGDESKGEWMINKKGTYVSVGVGGATTGKGANIFLIDDPIKNAEEAESEVYREKIWEWFKTVAWTRLEPQGVMIIILTRWHLDDLAGRIIKNEDFKKITKIINYPAIAEVNEKNRKIGEALWKNRYGIKDLEQTKSLIGIKNFSALYQQHPIATENQEFKPHYFKEREQQEVDKQNTRRFLTIDTAISQKASADYTGLCDNSVDTSNYWNLKAWRVKVSPLELMDILFTLHNNRRYEKIGIEKTIYLQTLKPFLDEEQRKRSKFLPIVELSHNQVNKELRIRGLIPRYETGSIYHIKGECRDLEEELLNFPQAINDDVSDAAAYQLQIAKKPFDNMPIYKSNENKPVAWR